ncbi:MAG: hypothetical protein V4792_09820 [Pseudomonadota bacterium]
MKACSNPDSMSSRALVSLKGLPREIPTRDYLTAINRVAETKEQAQALGDYLRERGYIRRCVVLTDEGLAALDAMANEVAA